jgi:hypothetical protein
MLVIAVDGTGLEGSSNESNSRGKSHQLRGDTIRTNLSKSTLLMIAHCPFTLNSASIKLREAADLLQATAEDGSQYGYLHQIAGGAQ